jgi:hypothetical protein
MAERIWRIEVKDRRRQQLLHGDDFRTLYITRPGLGRTFFVAREGQKNVNAGS